MGRKLTKEEFLERIMPVHGKERYNYDEVIYINSQTKIKIFCNTHKEFFWQTPNNHLEGRGCPRCAKNQTLSTKKFIEKSNIKHDFKYDYSKINYINVKTKIEIICPIHESFWQIPNNHLNGKGCPKCGGTKISNAEEFVGKANIKHDFKYDYSKVDYINVKTKIEIICRIHGSFWQTPSSHLNGNGCPKCGGTQISDAENFIEKSNIKHDFKYDYSKVDYINAREKVEIICPQHGSFYQTPDKHLQGKGCPKCTHHVSKLEMLWLDSLNIPNNKEHRNVYIKIKDRKLGFRVDGYDPITNTIYEFNGDFWHGNPEKFNQEEINKQNHKTFGELYMKTLEKKAILEMMGYKVISIWESDFKK